MSWLIRFKEFFAILKAIFSVPPANSGGGSSPPTPDPDNPTTPPDAGGAGDAIATQSIAWLHAPPAAFPVSSRLDEVSVVAPIGAAPVISWEWTHPGWLPVVGNGVGANMWVIAKVKGVWYGATWEWLRVNPMTKCKATEAKPGQPPFIQAKAWPINAWYPASGEEVGWMISTPCRMGYQGAVRGRSRILVTRWP